MANPKHKVTGLRLTSKGDDFTLTALTKSPRGTQTPFTQRKFALAEHDRTERLHKFAQEIDKILGRTE